MATAIPTETEGDQGGARALLFRVGATVYGCDLLAAQEIIPMRRATRVPGAPPYVLGLINVRGSIVTVIDLGVRLDAGRAPLEDGFILLVPRDGRLIGIAVEEILDVRSVDLDEIPGAAVEGGAILGLARADVELGGRTAARDVVLVDLEPVIQNALL